MLVRIRRTCLCSHTKSAHEHFRAGTDCGLCDCSRFHARYAVELHPRQPEQQVVLPEPYVEPVRPAAGVVVAPRESQEQAAPQR
jgi:hypothetical protein